MANAFTDMFSQLSPKGDYTNWTSSFSQKKPATPTPLVSANTAATAPVVPKPATTPAKQQFVQNQVQSTGVGGSQADMLAAGYNSNDPTRQAYAASAGYAPMATQNATTGQTGAPEATPTKKVKTVDTDPYRSAFDTYIKSLAIPEGLARSQNELASIDSDIFGKETKARHEYEQTLDTPGMLRAGAQDAATQGSRRNNAELADLATQRNALANSVLAQQGQYKFMTDAQKARFDFEKSMLDQGREDSRYEDETTREQTRYDAEQASKKNQPFDLSEGQSRYEYDPATGSYKTVASKGKTYAPSTSSGSGGGSNGLGGQVSGAAQNIIDIINAGGGDVDTLIKGTSREAQALRNEVYQGLAAQGGRPETTTTLYKEGKEIVDDLLNTKGYNALGGWSTRLGGQFGTSYGDAMAKAQQLGAILARDNLGLLKGAMSDKDLEFIKAMSTGFEGAGIQSEGYLKGRLETIQQKLASKIAESGAPSSSTGSSGTTSSGLKYTIIPSP